MKNKHESDRAREIAEKGTILQTQVGSGLHGTAVEAQDDRDEMGICIEPASCVIGLERFDQYQYRTQPEGHRSGPGDLDLVVYSLRKWARLAAQGNPTVLLMLFAPRSEWVKAEQPYADDLQANRSMFLSKECGKRFAGYLESQKQRVLGLKSRRTNRPELIEQYGFDTKFAYHAIRLGWQGIELMATSNITLPMSHHERELLVDLRQGAYTKGMAMDIIDSAQDALNRAIGHTSLPDEPDMTRINDWLTRTYQSHWCRV